MRQSVSLQVPESFRLDPGFVPKGEPVACLQSLGAKGLNLLAFGGLEVCETASSGEALHRLDLALKGTPDWWFGFLSYDLKNEIEKLESSRPDGLDAPLLSFFRPAFVLRHEGSALEVLFDPSRNEPEEARSWGEAAINFQSHSESVHPPVAWSRRITKDEYLLAVKSLQKHIRLGDIYEVNFCQEFYAQAPDFDMISAYRRLCESTAAPFSCFYRSEDFSLACGSPERFLRKQGEVLRSQPIKGTAPRGQSEEEDLLIRATLAEDRKERAENVMIVDLVRNDLSRVAQRGSVEVEELFGVYTFRTVHQLISTVNAKVRPEASFVDVMRATFPMGSMTGAPKIRAMELIEKYEARRRGLFSGAVGYITPEGDFDFNVVIRSLQYQSRNNYLSMMAGGAITAASDPLKEFEESELKARAVLAVANTEHNVFAG